MTQAWDFVDANVLWADNNDQLNFTPIDELEISIRSYNCLSNANIKTVGELTKRTRWELMRLPNFGRRSLLEVEEVLAQQRLSLAGDGHWK